MTLEFDKKNFNQRGAPLTRKDAKYLIEDLQKASPGLTGQKVDRYKIEFEYHESLHTYTKTAGTSVNKLAYTIDGMGHCLSSRQNMTSLYGLRS